MRILLLAIALISTSVSFAQPLITRFEKSNGTQTPTYYEAIEWWQKLDAASPKVKMLPMGVTDAGLPLHLILISNNGDHNLANIRKSNKRILLINNGIHPGEPDGIDACMLLAKDIVTNNYKLPDNVVLAIIPIYNIGGALNRSANYRVDQDGPEEFGFRGNSQNLDLNRDFIKCDSRDARAFASIFRLLDPDVFVDNHVSNGADYQHVMTLLASQHDKLGGTMGDFMINEFEPGIFSKMKAKGFDLIPYVNAFGDTPENGWPAFWDSPRYGTGYAALWNTFSFMPESHMLKPYDQRVKASYTLMQSFISFTSEHSTTIKKLRDDAKQRTKTMTTLPVSWSLDRNVTKDYLFKGYTAGRKPSDISGLPRLYYDRNQPFEKTIKIMHHYTPKESINKPTAYIVPQGWWRVADLLQLNKVNMQQLKQDTTIEVEVYKIASYKTSPRPYEMHHVNSEVKTTSFTEKVKFRKGDWLVPLNQEGNRFIMEVLEPQAEDSYFTWNYFDGILGQKEGYSAYAFEDIATEYLKTNPQLKQQLEQQRATDSTLAKSSRAQLDFIFQRSPWFEPAYLRYPIYRIK